MSVHPRVTAVLCCPTRDNIDASGAESAASTVSSPETMESHVVALYATDNVAALQQRVLQRSHRQEDVQVTEVLSGFEMRLSRGDGPLLVSNDLVLEVLRDGDSVYIMPSQQASKNELSPELNTRLLCEMLALDVDNFRWLMQVLIKRRRLELEATLQNSHEVLHGGHKQGFFGDALYGCFAPETGVGTEVQEEDEVFEMHTEDILLKPFDQSLKVAGSQNSTGDVQESHSQQLADIRESYENLDDDEGRGEEEADILKNENYHVAEFFEFEEFIVARDEEMHGKPGHVFPVVIFDRSMYYVMEGTPAVEITVLRTGDLLPEVAVSYRTVDASAVAGLKYKSAQGVLKFDSGVREQKLYVEIMENDSFDVILEFNILLEDPVNCRLSQHTKHSRVRIIDDDFFPSNYTRQVVADGRMRDASVRLFWEYLKSNFADSVIARGTIKAVLVDVYENIRFLALLIIQVFLLDVVLSKDTDRQAAPHLLMLCSAMFVSFFLCSHLCSYRMCFWRIGGRSRQNLLRNLMRKFLNYSPNSRAAIVDTDVMLMITRDIPRVVSDGYMEALELLKHILKVFFILFYQLVMPYVYIAFGLEKEVTPRRVVMSLAPIVIYPLLMGAFLKMRAKKIHSALYAEEDAQNNLIQFADECIHSVELMRDYRLKNKTIDDWEAKVVNWSKAMVLSASRHCNNKYFAPWLTEIICAAWVFVGGILVKESQSTDGGSGISIGDFLVTWRIFTTAGAAWASMYACILTMQEAAPALENITMLMNLSTDSRDVMTSFDRQCDLQKSVVAQILDDQKLQQTIGQDYANLIPIKMMNFEHYIMSDGAVHGCLRVDKDMPQGLLYLLVGGRGSGKATLLNILAGSILPYRETITDLQKRVQEVLEETLHPENNEGAPIKGQDCDSPATSFSLRSIVTGLSGGSGTPKSAKSDCDEGRVLGSPILTGDAVKEDLTAGKLEVVKGEFLMPSHLHVLHVPLEPQFIRGTLFDNLTLGVEEHQMQKDGSESRVIDICKALALPAFIIEMIQRRQVCQCSALALSHRVLLGLARAFITNPEVLVLHKPMMNLNRSSGLRVMKLLRSFVDNRGLYQDPEKFWLRRPRTCFMSGKVSDGCDIADVIYEVHRDIKEIAVHRQFKEAHDAKQADSSGKGAVTEVSEPKLSQKAAKLYRSATWNASQFNSTTGSTKM